MNDTQRLAALRIVLIVVGLIAVFAIWPLMILWPTGWTWHSGHSDYPLMIVGIYATLGVFLILAARNPAANASLIWFTAISSAVHALIMAVQASGDPMQRGHLIGDVPALLLVTLVLGGLMLSRRGRATV